MGQQLPLGTPTAFHRSVGTFSAPADPSTTCCSGSYPRRGTAGSPSAATKRHDPGAKRPKPL